MSGHAEAKNENELNKYRRTEAQARKAAEARGSCCISSHIEVIVCTETNNVSGSRDDTAEVVAAGAVSSSSLAYAQVAV